MVSAQEASDKVHFGADVTVASWRFRMGEQKTGFDETFFKHQSIIIWQILSIIMYILYL